MDELEDDDWVCPNCHTFPALGEGLEIPEHRLCGPCASDEVTRLRDHLKDVTEKWEKHANELALLALKDG